MELPNIGEHCSDVNCHQLDYLPVKCDACKKIFCNIHYPYSKHDCPNAYQKDNQVPICPLCNTPVPGKSTELPDIRVNRHLDTDCQSDTALKRRKEVYSNKCCNKGCKQKELVPIVCDKCSKNFCIKHRLPQDHSCVPIVASGKSLGKSALAALNRNLPSSSSASNSASNAIQYIKSVITPSRNENTVNRVDHIQGNMSEDAAMALAIEASLQDGSQTQPEQSSQEYEDFLLAKALSESEMESQNNNPSGEARRDKNKSCKIS